MFQFGVLGPLEVRRRGDLVELPRPRTRAALGFLLLNASRPVSIEQLVDALWGEEPPRTARAQVHTVISTLRQALSLANGELLSFDGIGYRLTVPEADLDAAAFTKSLTEAQALVGQGAQEEAARCLRRGLSLWRGEALSGIEAPFAEPVRAWLAEKRFAAHELLADIELALGRQQGLVPDLQVLLSQYPTRESIAERLATALYRSGRQTDALAVVRDVRERLAEEYGLDPARSLLELENAMLRGEAALPEQTTPATVDGPGVPSRLRPAQLPQQPYGFVGRRAELAKLSSVRGSSPGDAPIAVVTGAAGSGKTSLVLRWAHAVADEFSDGQLFVDLHGYDENERESAPRVLERFLLALGIPGHQIPEDPALREDLFRSTVADRKLLVVLDNAYDYQQVRSLLPGTPKSFTVVTSRGRLGGLVAQTGAVPVQLGMLPQAEAVEVLVGLAGADRVAAAPEAAARLADLCGGLPLALRISAVRLLDEPDEPLSALAAELSAEEARLTGLGLPGDEMTVSRALEHSYRRLPDEQARLFRLLSLHPGDGIPLAAASALLGDSETPLMAAPTPESRRLVRSLEAVHLLERVGVDPGRHRMHDLVRLFGRQIMPDSSDEGRAALGRLMDWYIVHADAACQVLDPKGLRLPVDVRHGWFGPVPFAGEDEAQQWFSQESENLIALVRLAAVLGVHRVVWQLAVLQSTHLLRSHRLGVLAEIQQVGEQSAVALGHERASATLANNLGIAYAIRRDRQAKGHFERAIERYLELGELQQAARCRLNLGSLHYEFRELTEAAAYQEQAVEAARSIDDKFMLGLALANLALVRTDQGRHERARRLLLEAVALQESNGTEHSAAVARGQLAWVLHRLGSFQEAFELSERSLADATRFGDRLVAGRMLDQMGMARAAQSRLTEARAYWEQAVETFVDIGSAEADGVRARLNEHRT